MDGGEIVATVRVSGVGRGLFVNVKANVNEKPRFKLPFTFT